MAKVMPRYTLPGRPAAQGGALPFLGPYQYNQAQATLAYQRAMALLAQQRGSALLDYGYTQGADGSIAVDPNNPYGGYQQMARQNFQMMDNADNAVAARGLETTEGLGAGQEANAKYAAGAAANNLGRSLTSALANLAQAGAENQYSYQQNTLDNRLNSIRYAQQHNLFNPHDDQLGQSVVNRRTASLAAAWAKKYGAHGKNKAGQTFNQRLNTIGAKLYNPNAHYGIAGRRY